MKKLFFILFFIGLIQESNAQTWEEVNNFPTAYGSSLIPLSESNFIVFNDNMFWLSNDSGKTFKFHPLSFNNTSITGAPNIKFFNYTNVGLGFVKEKNNPKNEYLYYSKNLDTNFSLLPLKSGFSKTSKGCLPNSYGKLLLYKVGVDSNSNILPQDSIFTFDTTTNKLNFFEAIITPPGCNNILEIYSIKLHEYYILYSSSNEAIFDEAFYYISNLSGKVNLLKTLKTRLNELYFFDDTTIVLGDNLGGLELLNTKSQLWENISVGKEKLHEVINLEDSSFILQEKHTYTSQLKEPTTAYFTLNRGKTYSILNLPENTNSYQRISFEKQSKTIYIKTLTKNNIFQTFKASLSSLLINDTLLGGVNFATEIEGHNYFNKILIYPNPTNQNFTIEANEIFKSVKLYNTIGQLVLATSPKQNITQIEVSHLPKGLYFVQILQQNGDGVLKKVVVY